MILLRDERTVDGGIGIRKFWPTLILCRISDSNCNVVQNPTKFRPTLDRSETIRLLNQRLTTPRVFVGIDMVGRGGSARGEAGIKMVSGCEVLVGGGLDIQK